MMLKLLLHLPLGQGAGGRSQKFAQVSTNLAEASAKIFDTIGTRESNRWRHGTENSITILQYVTLLTSDGPRRHSLL